MIRLWTSRRIGMTRVLRIRCVGWSTAGVWIATRARGSQWTGPGENAWRGDAPRDRGQTHIYYDGPRALLIILAGALFAFGWAFPLTSLLVVLTVGALVARRLLS